MDQGVFRLFFDGSCGLCRAIVRRLRRARASAPIDPVDIHGPRMDQFPQIDRAEAERSVILLEPPRRQRHGYDAVLGVMDLLPAARRLTPLLRLGPVRAMGGAVYRWVSRHRHRISKVFGLK